MILSSFLFALMGVCVRLASRTVPVTEIVFFRSAIGFLIIVPLLLSQKASFLGRRPGLLILRGLTGFCALSFYFWAISKIPLATAVMLNYTSPLFVALLAPLILKERFNIKIFFLILLGFAGVVLIVNPQGGTHLAGALIGLISGIFAAFAYLCIGALRIDHSSLTIVFYFFWVSTLLSIPLAWPSFKTPNFAEAFYLFGTGLLATVAQILMTRAYSPRFGEAGRLGTTAGTSAYSSGIVIFSLVFGMIFWKEIPSIASLVGGLLVVISVVFTSRLERTEVLSTEQ